VTSEKNGEVATYEMTITVKAPPAQSQPADCCQGEIALCGPRASVLALHVNRRSNCKRIYMWCFERGAFGFIDLRPRCSAALLHDSNNT
jgi:hypothetical protein